MEFKNLDCNIIHILGDAWRNYGTTGPFKASLIYNEFADIPDENLTAAIIALRDDCILKLHGSGNKVSITSKGLAEIKSMRKSLDIIHKGPNQLGSDGHHICRNREKSNCL